MMEILKTITGISKFLHSEMGKKYIAIFWPEVKKRLSARGLGRLAANITFVYKKIDEKVYDNPGVVDEQTVVIEAEAAEQEAVMNNNYTEVPRFVDVWSKYESIIDGVLKPMHQKSIGTCGIHTIQNMVNQIIIERGLEEVIELDISLMYRDYRHQRGNGVDSGTVMEYLFRKLIEDGIPVRTTKVITNRKHLLALDQNKTIEAGRQFRLFIFDSIVSRGYTIEKMAQDFEKYSTEGHKVQASLDVYRHKSRSKSLWWRLIVDWVDGMYKTGRHSTAVLFATINGEKLGVMEHEGERGYISLDSGDGYVKFMKESYLKKARWNYRIVKLKESFLTDLPSNIVVNPEDVLATRVIKYGQRSSDVMVLQKYLIDAGFAISSATGYFGNETRRALEQWQINVLGKSYGGTVWGSISQKTYKLLKSQ